MNRILLLGTAWVGAATASVGLGFLAVSLVDASSSTAALPASSTGTVTATPSGSAAPSSPDVVPTAQRRTEAGTVYASCAQGRPALAGAPAAGWVADDSNDPGEFEFHSGARTLEVTVTCVGGVPQFSVEKDAAPRRAAPRTTDAPDDSDGRIGGGHGSDDPPGDDSAGRTGGGHGSDDPPGDDSAGRTGGGHGSDDPAGDDSGGDSDDSDEADDPGDDAADDSGKGRGSDD